MKKKKILIYLLSIIAPILIFLLCTFLNGYLPFKDELLNSYDSFTQYPGILLEYIRLLKNGGIFYSWGAGLGLNFFGTLTYYCISPLNLLAIFANPNNYHFFITFMTLLRFGLLGFTMCFYLSHKNVKPLYVVVFSIIYALMGYTSTYYYNFLWIDSIIMLPLVIHGLDKLIDKGKPLFYLICLSITIMINYYIGYMICIFSLIWFIYRIFFVKNKKVIIKKFIIASLLAGLIGAVVILPSFFALLTGKASIYSSVDYGGFTNNILSFFYSLTSGSYAKGDQINGPAQIYSSILVLVLTVFYFFNTKYSKKQKLATLGVIVLFYLSFSVKFINYAWQLFQKPIWWQSRFSFAFSFFLIVIAADVLMNIKYTKFKIKYRVIIALLLIIITTISAFVKWQSITNMQVYTYFFYGFSALLIIEMFFLLDKKEFLLMILLFTIAEISLNCYNSLKQNYRYKSYNHFEYIRKELPNTLEELNKENDNFFRMEFMDDYTSNDGLYFGFNGINYFNSARNIKVVTLMEKLGFKVTDHCHFILSNFDPILLSIFNIKYLYGISADYYKEVNKNIYENPYPLALGFMANNDIKNFLLDSDDPLVNREKLLFSLSGLDDKIYTNIGSENFKHSLKNGKDVLSYSFKSDGHYLIMPEKFSGGINVNGTDLPFGLSYREVFKGDEVVVNYTFAGNYDIDKIKVNLFNLDNYSKHMEVLNKDLMNSKTNVDGHILQAKINVSEDDKYLFTSIEYEEGMKVYVDGTLVDPDIIVNSLIGLKLDKGEHEIVIDYIPKGFISGSIVSVSSLLLTIVWCVFQKKEKIL